MPPARGTSASAPSLIAPSRSSSSGRREHPGVVNGVRPLLNEIAVRDGNEAVRRLAIVSLKNGSPDRGTIQLLEGLGADDEQDKELRDTASKVAQALKKKSRS